MTLYKPSLFVNRFVVLSGDHRGYDERFHRGLNIITGERNAVGKSTIANLMAFALGADYSDWTPEALQFDTVLIEIELNGAFLTLSRPISNTSARPMNIYWGDLDEAIESGFAKWKQYPYRKTDQKESFSSVLFELLGFPVIHNAMSGKLTMHQLIRLIFVDQLTPFNQMFGNEQFDSPVVRREVGAILCGYYSSKEYQLRDKLRQAETELIELKAHQKILDKFILNADQNVSVLSVQSALDKAEERLRVVEEAVKNSIKQPRTKKEITNEYELQLRTAQERVESTAHAVGVANDKLFALQFEKEDSREFIESLDKTLSALGESESIRDALGELPISNCPSCHHPIVKNDEENRCQLCKEPRKPGADKTQLLRMRHELTMQYDESVHLQSLRSEELRKLQLTIPLLNKNLETSRLELDRLRESIDPVTDAELGNSYREAGYLQGVIEDLERQMKLVVELDSVHERRIELEAGVDRLTVELEVAENLTKERRALSRDLVASRTVEILHKDERDENGIPVEEGLAECEEVRFSFSKGRVWVDNRQSLSASSMVFLKNSFHLAILIASLEDKEFRYPRLLIMDNIEDKGMQPSRSHKFQLILKEISDSSKVDHQIIITTSMIADDLRHSEHIVGEYYTSDRKSLHLPQSESENTRVS